MVGNERSRRRFHPTLITSIIALAAQACSNAESTGTPGGGSSGAGGSSSAGANSLAGGVSAFGGSLISVPEPDPPCPGGNLLSDQRVTAIGSQRVFYTWTTDEQVAELRAGGPLFSRSESPGKGRGLAMTQLAALAAAGSEPVNALAGTLVNSLFAKVRFSWPNPWATLMGWPGETYGNQLLRVSLRPDAWIASFSASGGLSVRDFNAAPVDITVAAATPERIGAIYFESDADRSVVSCGTFSQGSVAFREFVLGNLQMVESWSLATPEITTRLQSDIAALEAFGAELDCKYRDSPANWANEVSCALAGEGYGLSPSMLSYDLALGMPSELYFPNKENIAALVAALKASLPQGEPLSVKPGG